MSVGLRAKMIEAIETSPYVRGYDTFWEGTSTSMSFE